MRPQPGLEQTPRKEEGQSCGEGTRRDPAANFPCVLLTPPSSFLVEKQPPQVLKTQTKFQAGVRFLLGLRFLAAPAKPLMVRADMVTEKQARELSMPQGPGAGV